MLNDYGAFLRERGTVKPYHAPHYVRSVST
jgi:hypothetical protein